MRHRRFPRFFVAVAGGQLIQAADDGFFINTDRAEFLKRGLPAKKLDGHDLLLAQLRRGGYLPSALICRLIRNASAAEGKKFGGSDG